MLRLILGVIAGFIVWSIVWVGLDALLAAISPNWFGRIFNEFQNAVNRNEPFSRCFGKFILFPSVLCSLQQALRQRHCKGNRKTTLALGHSVAFNGIFVEAGTGIISDLVSRFVFVLLIPATVLAED
jgi:hypothetical protein